MTQAAYARRRGVSREAVSRAIKKGRLRESLVQVGRRKMIADPELADREWDATTDLTRAPHQVKARASERAAGGAAGPADIDAGVYDLAVEVAREKFWKANLAELEYRTKAGELVAVVEVEEKFVDAVTAAKTKLLGIAARVRQRMPHIAAEDIRAIDDLVREALEDLSHGR